MEVIRVWSFPFFVVVWLVSKTEAVCTSNTPIMENHECCCFPQKHFVKIIHLHWTRNNHMTLSITRNLGVFTQRKEGGYQVLGLHRKNAECGLEHWCLWAQTVDLEVAEPSEQWPGGGEKQTHKTQRQLQIYSEQDTSPLSSLNFHYWTFLLFATQLRVKHFLWRWAEEAGVQPALCCIPLSARCRAGHAHAPLHTCKSQIVTCSPCAQGKSYKIQEMWHL